MTLLYCHIILYTKHPPPLMNYQENPFDESNFPHNQNHQLKDQLAEQDVHLSHLHSSLLQVRHQTGLTNSELQEHNNLLNNLSNQIDNTEDSFTAASRKVRKLYTELTEKQFTWTASIMIFILTILLIFLLVL